MFSFGKPLSDRKAPAYAERFGCDLQARSRLLALVFVAIHFIDNIAHPSDRQMKRIGNLLRRFVVFDVAAKNLIEYIVLWKGIGVLLIGPQLGGGRLNEDIVGNGISVPLVRDPRQRVDQRFGNVADDGQAAAHVAVERAIADRELAL